MTLTSDYFKNDIKKVRDLNKLYNQSYQKYLRDFNSADADRKAVEVIKEHLKGATNDTQ